MMEYSFSLLRTPLFEGISERELDKILVCLGAKQRKYKKDTYVLSAGEKAGKVGILLEGRVHVIKEDFWGDRYILTSLGPGELFGEAFSCVGERNLPVSVVAVQDCVLLFIDYAKVIGSCKNICPFHAKLVGNMLRILATKNILLTEKMEYLIKKTTREKLLSYLSAQALQRKKQAFDIPFNRQELADFLSVDRSAMSAELSKLKKEGMIDYRKNHFCLRSGHEKGRGEV